MGKVRRPKEVIDGLLWIAPTPAKWKANTNEEKEAWYRENNIQHVVILCNLFDEHLREPGTPDYLHLPLVDGGKGLDPRLYSIITPVVLKWINNDEPTLVCCLVGRNRSGAACTLIAREYFNENGAEALLYVRSRRPGAVKRAGPEAELKALGRPK